MSALPSKADKEQTSRFVRFVPKADIAIRPLKTKSLGIVRGFEFHQKFSTPLVQYFCTLPMREGGFAGAATP